MATHLATAISADGVVLAYGNSTAAVAGSSAGTAPASYERPLSKSIAGRFVAMTEVATSSATPCRLVPNATGTVVRRSAAVASQQGWTVVQVETIHADRDKTDPCTSFHRWLLRGISAIPDPSQIGDIIIATRDMSALVKEVYAQVCMRDPEALAEYVRVTGEVAFWFRRVYPSRAVAEGHLIFTKRNG